MYLIIGLGNPGEEFRNSRHNIGREIVAQLQEKLEFPAFRFEKKWNAQVSEGKIHRDRAVAVLPDTMMNKSGTAVAPLVRFYKLKPRDLIVIHDDADIPFGRGKLSFGRSSAGHKGVESVIRALKTKGFWRFRIGIAGRRDIPAEKLVLKKFTAPEGRVVKKVVQRTVRALEQGIAEGPEQTMNWYNSDTT
jgi:PTH1 family peptidyl-tRNA hydrolase